MNKELTKKFIGGAISGAAVAATAFISEKCNVSDLKQFGILLALAVGSGVFHYLKNGIPQFIDKLNNGPIPPDIRS